MRRFCGYATGRANGSCGPSVTPLGERLAEWAITSTPAMGCSATNLASRASAGGQLEHPCEVNNSTRTGV